tara:strand:- start:83 stop:559 length:477 start_codon:yes stop_codon:yes gene_type:complete
LASNLNCYELLRVSPTANNAELRKAFLKLSKLLHPDTTALPNDEATRKFQSVCEAYDLLSDPVLRANYDLSLKKENNRINQELDIDLTSKEPIQFSESIGVRRPFSGGELFSLLLLIITIVLSLGMVIFISLLKDDNLIFVPTWMMSNILLITSCFYF